MDPRAFFFPTEQNGRQPSEPLILCQALEWALKAFLYHRGVPRWELDIEQPRLLKMAEDRNLRKLCSVDRRERQILCSLCASCSTEEWDNIDLRYLHDLPSSSPSLEYDEAQAVVIKLLDAVEAECGDSLHVILRGEPIRKRRMTH